MTLSERDKRAASTVNAGLYTNIFLAIFKTVIGIIGHSQALLADGINSTSDVTYYIAVKIFMKQANKPADKEHPYGHRQLESISALIVGAFILTTAVAIFWQSINSFFDMVKGVVPPAEISYWALIIAIITVISKVVLFSITNRTHKATRNPALKALANDHLNDIMATVGVTIGIVMSKLGYHWVDPLAGAVVAVFILKTGIEIIADSSGELMDSVPDDKFQDEVRGLVGGISGVLGVDDIATHRYGASFIINLTILVDGGITVREGDNLADQVESKLFEQYRSSLAKVNIHYHPQR